MTEDQFLDDDDFEIEDCSTPSPEDAYMMGALLDDFINHLRSIKPRYADMVTLGHAGFEPEEIFEKLGLKKSRGYQEYDTCYKLVVDFLFSDK